MDETEFKKLTSNSRDWLIYQLLSDKSKEVVRKGLSTPPIEVMHNAEDKPTTETSVQENIQGIVRTVTALAVQIVVGIRATWIPKSAIKNLNEVVLEQGKPVSVDIKEWLVPKLEWKVI